MSQQWIKEAAIIFLLAFISYSPSLVAEFTFDDRPAILENEDIVLQNGKFQTITNHLQRIFQHDFWGANITDHSTSHKSYRPLTVLTFIIDNYIQNNILSRSNISKNPFLFHLNNIILHGVNAVLFYTFLYNTLKQLHVIDPPRSYRTTSWSLPFIAATIFAADQTVAYQSSVFLLQVFGRV